MGHIYQVYFAKVYSFTTVFFGALVPGKTEDICVECDDGFLRRRLLLTTLARKQAFVDRNQEATPSSILK